MAQLRLALIILALSYSGLSYGQYQLTPELFRAVAAENQLPKDLLYAIALNESKTKTKSGKIVAWPWTLNYKKKGYFFKTKSDLYQSVKAILATGDTNFDICVMQINWRYHSERFSNIEEALSPPACVSAAADYLVEITGMPNRRNWKQIVGGYHNFNSRLGNQYANRVKKICKDANLSCYSP